MHIVISYSLLLLYKFNFHSVLTLYLVLCEVHKLDSVEVFFGV